VAIASGVVILLVDDTQHLREIVEELLLDLGHEVLSASHAEEALRIVASYRGRIAILLTDIHMPGMSGPDLAERIRVTHPEIRPIFMSGSGPQARDDPGVIQAGGAVLEKPFNQEQLAKAVEERLAG
jgi:CheY-like chemotaxis protein